MQGLLRRSFIQLYSKAQIALRETLSDTPSEPPHADPELLPQMLTGAELHHVSIADPPPAAGRMIGELRLRNVTRASIVSIERAGENIINPGPDEEIQAGDGVLLIGSPSQLEAARAFLDQKAFA